MLRSFAVLNPAKHLVHKLAKLSQQCCRLFAVHSHTFGITVTYTYSIWPHALNMEHAKCLRIDLWLTLHATKDFTYLLTYLLKDYGHTKHFDVLQTFYSVDITAAAATSYSLHNAK